MALSWRARAFATLVHGLTRAGLLPSAEKAASVPHAKRLAVSVPRFFTGKPPASVTTLDEELPAGGRVRLYRPSSGTLPVLIFIHGGGWTAGGIAGTNALCAQLAAESGCAVVSVEYRLAPDYPYPIPLDDCWSALLWVEDNAGRLALDAARIAVSGDSAGGNLAAALAQRAAAKGRALAAQILLNPAVDATRSQPSAREYIGPGLSVEDLRACWDLYRGQTALDDPGLSPFFAPEFGHLPPALVVTAGHDPLVDEGAAYVEKLLAAGVKAELLHNPDGLHGFVGAPRIFPEAVQYRAQIAAFARQHLHATPPRQGIASGSARA